MNVVIIDDEKHCRELLKAQINRYCDFKEEIRYIAIIINPKPKTHVPEVEKACKGWNWSR